MFCSMTGPHKIIQGLEEARAYVRAEAADPPDDFHEMWQAATRRNVLLHARLMRLRARLARRTALAAGLGFFAVIGWAHIVMSFGSGEGWW